VAGERILIAAFSGRALAQSARRAGFEPLVVDAFGDLDTRAAAAAFRIVPGAMQTGFRTKPLVRALDELASASRAPPIGLVLGSGLEDKPRLVASLQNRYRLLGSAAETYKSAKDPRTFFAALDDLDIAHPETQTSPPADPSGFISKRIGGSGGRHIRMCHGPQHLRPRRYFQRHMEGDRISAGAIFWGRSATGSHSLISLTRQWISPSADEAFRFGGCVSGPDVDDKIRATIIDAAERVATRFNLVGMASFDFIVSHARPHLLEVNPRPGASLDVLDDDEGYWFKAHVAACCETSIPQPHRPPRFARAIAIAHADRGPLTLGDTPWPDWSADRGAPGTAVPTGAPLATVFAEAPTADAAEALARTRLADLQDLIYGHAKS
jgi:predicted ATP-grasp superfamily ATP-dependent carboligase